MVVSVAVMMMAGRNILRVDVRTKIVSWNPKVGVCVAGQCG